MDHLYLNNDVGWILIFYTGKERLSPAIENHLTATTILIKRRPDLHSLVPNIIYGIESGVGVPESIQPSKYLPYCNLHSFQYYTSNIVSIHIILLGEKSLVKGLIANKVRELEAASLTEEEIIEELTILAHESGFLLSNMVSEDDQTSGRSLLEAVKERFSIYEPRFHETIERNGHHQRIRRRQSSRVRTVMHSKSMTTEYRPWEQQEGAHEFVKGLGK